MKKIILFDLDGTLIDSSEGIIKSVLHALNYYGIEETNLESLRRFIGPPLSDSFVNFYGFSKEQGWEAVEKFRERYNVKGFLECKLYPGIKEMLAELKRDGYALGIATSKPEITARKILSNLGVIDLFDEISGATMDGKIETKAEVLQELFRRQESYQSKDMVLVGDTAFDVIGAKEFNITPVGVSYGFGDTKEMEEAGAVCICKDANEVVLRVKEL